MREILFRGKSKNNLPLGHWVYGDLHTFGYKCFIDGYEENTRVKEDTVGQYTGLCDKNGKKIFEGDIVKYEDDSGYPNYETFINVGKIIYEGNAFWVSERNRVEMGDLVDYSNNTMECEVIGNIYDNPELLEVSD